MRTRLFLVAIVGAFLLLGPAPASLADTIDQSFVGPNTGGASVGYGGGLCCSFMAQTFTAGLNGTLTGVNINVYDYGSSGPVQLQVTIQSVAGGSPSGTILGSTTINSNISDLSQLITFPQTIAMVAGTEYAIVVQVPFPSGALSWYGAHSDPYAGGVALYSYNDVISGNSWHSLYTPWNGDVDFNFQTHVDTSAAVPEPGTLLLFCTGIAGLWLKRRRAAAN